MSKLRSEYTIDRLHERQKGSLPGLLGVRVTGLEEGVLTAELTVRSELLAPNSAPSQIMDGLLGSWPAPE